MSLVFTNQSVLITGAGRGIGAAAAKLFAALGAKVVVSDRDAGPAEEAVDAIRDAGGDAIAIVGDITDPDFPQRLVEGAVETYGGLHVLVNNAGYTWDSMLHKMTDKQWEAILAVHATAPFRLVRAAAPFMRDAAKQEMDSQGMAQPRCVINVSSTSGLHGNVGQLNYATAKMGMVGFTKTVAREWGPFNIRCNAVAFGYMETRLTQAKESGESVEVDGEQVHLGVPERLHEMLRMSIPLGRMGTVEEASGGIVMLASPWASYITGHTLEVTGGLGI